MSRVIYCIGSKLQVQGSLIKKKIKCSSDILKFKGGAVAKLYCMIKGLLIYEEMRKYLVIFEEAVSHV